MACLIAKNADADSTNGGSPSAREPMTAESSFVACPPREIFTRKSIGIDLLVGGLYSHVPFENRRPSGSYINCSEVIRPRPCTYAPSIWPRSMQELRLRPAS